MRVLVTNDDGIESPGLTVLAEGVETERQQALLEACGCDELQGWVFSAELPEEQLPDFLGRQAAKRCGE